MDIKNSEYRFSPLVIGLHWLTVILIIAVYASMELRGLAPKGALRDAMKSLHYRACPNFCVNGSDFN